jgi:hypothetical protein
MKVATMVLPDWPANRHDWREDWPDDTPAVILEVHKFNSYTIMAGDWIEEVNGEYLVEIV